jgi:YVTN family beta-propeller protein
MKIWEKLTWLKLALAKRSGVPTLIGIIFLASVMILGYGGLCSKSKSDKDTIVRSSNVGVGTIVSGIVYEQTGDYTMVPAGNVIIVGEWNEGSAGQSVISQNVSGEKKSVSTKTKSDGSYELTGVPNNTPVTITITSNDTTHVIEKVTTSDNSATQSAILKGKGKKIGLIKNNQDTILNTFDDNTLPRCQITISSTAVSATIDNVYLTPTHKGENLPQLPDGYVFLGGGDFTAPSDVDFASGKEATPYIILPPAVKAEDLTTVDIKLMEYVNGAWVINTGKGKLFTTGQWAGYIGPHDTDTPAKLKGVHPWCWVGVQSSPAQISGTITTDSGSPISGALIFGGGSKTHSKKDGTYLLKNINVLKPTTLVPINVTANDYQMGYQYVSLSPGSSISDVDFTLTAITQLGEIYGKVTNTADDSPIYGAIVNLYTNPTIRGMKYDSKNTQTDLTDDSFFVIPPPGITITNYKWMLTLPSAQTFTSLTENGASIIVNQLATEATNNGYSLTVGAYKVELEVTYSGGKKVIVTGGFLLKQSGFVNYIADVKLPVSIQDELVLKTVTDSQGNYRFVKLPTGEALYAQAKAMGFISSNTIGLAALSSAEKRQQDFSLADVGTDTEPPSQPTNFTGTVQSAYSILLTWSPSTDTNGIEHYRVYRDGVEIGKTTDTSYFDSGLNPNTLYQYIIGAFDRANLSRLSSAINITTPSDVIDNTPPTTPTNLAATVIGPTQINLTWWASTDDVGVIGYKVYQNGSEIANTNVTNYANIGLSASTPYTYTVIAYDQAGNPSPESSPVSATTSSGADTTPPSVPTMNGAIALSSSSIAISWTASTDNVGVIGYKVYRSPDDTNYTLRSTLGTTTSYSDSDLSTGTYWYKVSAYDAAGNTSAQSSPPASATTTGQAVDDYVWVANYNSANVTRIKKSDLTTSTIGGMGTGIFGVAVDETYCWVTNYASNNVTRINKSDLTTINISAGAGPFGVAVDATYVWVANYNSNSVTKILKSNPAITTTITVGSSPCGVAVDGIYCWVANMDNTVTRIKKSDLTTTNISVVTGPYATVAVDETYCWVVNSSDSNVTRILKSNPAITTTIAVGTSHRAVAVDETYVWVANTGSGSVTRILKSDLTTTNITVGTGPFGVAVDSNYVWAVNSGSGSVTRILKSDITQKTTITGVPLSYCTGDMTGYAYDNIPP